MRRFCQIVDEFTSDQNARHAQQGLIETARQGFWPVVKAPFGYEKYEAEWRGSKPKWKLRIEASEAAIVREIYSLYTSGHPADGRPMGIKAIVSYLNESGKTRRGVRFRVSSVERILKSTIYTGRSEEHTSELQSLMRISYAVFCLQKQ